MKMNIFPSAQNMMKSKNSGCWLQYLLYKNKNKQGSPACFWELQNVIHFA